MTFHFDPIDDCQRRDDEAIERMLADEIHQRIANCPQYPDATIERLLDGPLDRDTLFDILDTPT